MVGLPVSAPASRSLRQAQRRQNSGVSNRVIKQRCGFESTMEDPISMAEVVRRIGKTCRQMERLFREELGKSPLRVRDQLRSAVINAVVAIPLMIIMMLMATQTRVMGQQATGLTLQLFGWIATMFMALAAIEMNVIPL